MEPIVLATWGLVIATGLLVLRSLFDGRAQERRASNQLDVLRQQAAALADSSKAQAASAAALSESAKATQAMADEMFEARKSERPLELRATLEDGTGPGVFVAKVWRASSEGIVIARAELLAGHDRIEAAQPTTYANQYLGGEYNQFHVNTTYDRQGRDLVVLRVTGTPANGVEQSVEFLFRVLAQDRLEPLSSDDPPWLPSGGRVGGVA